LNLDVIDLRESALIERPIERHSTVFATSTDKWRSKRLFDVVGALFFLLFAVPLMIVLGILIKLSSRGPVLYRSRRFGRHGRIFYALKLRTMENSPRSGIDKIIASDAEAAREWRESVKLSNDPRVTRLGHFLRRTSLDELPQFFNVLFGDMSLVGPRPKLLSERESYGGALEEVLTVRPGLTGLWQVSGRSTTTYERRIELDLRYVREPSLAKDVKILLRTAAHLANPRDEAR
jgi:lipopolysaccharide/colanic/teichoic acid biosynthesis glycosyltransferase